MSSRRRGWNPTSPPRLTSDDLEGPFKILYEQAVRPGLPPKKCLEALKYQRHFYLGPLNISDPNAPTGRELRMLVTLKKQQLQSKSRTTATEDAFLFVLDLPINDKESKASAFDEKLMLVVFLQELCKLVKTANQKTASPGEIKSRNYELGEYLLVSVFTIQNGIPVEDWLSYARTVNARMIEYRNGKKAEAAFIKNQACQIFFSEVFRYTIELDWMQNTRMFDQCFTKKSLSQCHHIKASFVKELLHQGKSPDLCSSDAFLESMLIECGDFASPVEDEEDVGDETLHLRSTIQQNDKIVSCARALFTKPTEQNWRQLAEAANLSPDLTNKSKELGQLSQDQVLLHQLMKFFDLPLFIRTAFELAGRYGNPEYVLQARQAFHQMTSGIGGEYSEKLWESIEQDILADSSSNTDEANEIGASTREVHEVELGSVSDGSSEHGNDAAAGPALGNDRRNLVNRLFTVEGLRNSSLNLLLTDGTPTVHGTYSTARWACMTGSYLRIDDFKIFKCFGAGSEGVVVAAYQGDPKDKKMVAIKFMLISGKEEYLNYFDRHTSNWFLANGHENILMFLGYGQINSLSGRPLPFGEKIMMFQVTEICKCDLKTVLKQKQKDVKTGRLSFLEYCHFYADALLEIAEGWGFLASLGIVHRDMKPANIMIGRDDKIKIGDLGLARRETTPVTPNTEGLGSPFYMAPEQIRSGKWNGELTTAADAFALGVMSVENVAFTHKNAPRRRLDDHGLNKKEMKALKKYMMNTRGMKAGLGLLEIGEGLCPVDPDQRLTPHGLKVRLRQWKSENPIHPAVASPRTRDLI